MPLPTRDEIIDAVKDSSNIKVPLLKGFSPKDGLFGEPLYYKGGFGLVFPFISGKNKIAFRVWFNEVEGIKSRMKDILAFMKKNPLPYFVNFDVYEKGLFVKTNEGHQTIDVMTMDWINGKDLKKYVNDAINSDLSQSEIKSILLDLLKKIYNLFVDLHKIGISHGDLQHTNIIIDDNNAIKLIDYDSFFVPGMVYTEQITGGYIAYQHPNRKDSVYANEKNDYFSELIIFMSLLAIYEDFSIWDRYKIAKRDLAFTFDERDYKDIQSSSLFKEFQLLSPLMKKLCQILQYYLTIDKIDNLSPFQSYLNITDLPFSVASDIAKYCIICGNCFENEDDKYCIRCGSKRHISHGC